MLIITSELHLSHKLCFIMAGLLVSHSPLYSPIVSKRHLFVPALLPPEKPHFIYLHEVGEPLQQSPSSVHTSLSVLHEGRYVHLLSQPQSILSLSYRGHLCTLPVRFLLPSSSPAHLLSLSYRGQVCRGDKALKKRTGIRSRANKKKMRRRHAGVAPRHTISAQIGERDSSRGPRPGGEGGGTACNSARMHVLSW